MAMLNNQRVHPVCFLILNSNSRELRYVSQRPPAAEGAKLLQDLQGGFHQQQLIIIAGLDRRASEDSENSVITAICIFSRVIPLYLENSSIILVEQ